MIAATNVTDLRGRVRSASLVLAILVGGLQAGTYFIFTNGVMPGLALGDDRTFVAAMQQFNVSIINPLFLATFLGAPLLALLAVVAHLGDRPATLRWVTGGFLLAAATVVITTVVHVPLNDALGAAGPPDRIADLSAVRAAFVADWVPWNAVRAVTSAGSLAALACASLLSGRHGAAPRRDGRDIRLQVGR